MIKNLFKYIFSEMLVKVLPMVTSLYLAKILGPEDFGQFSLILVLAEVFLIGISFNIQATTRLDYYKQDIDTFWNTKKHHAVLSFLSFIILLLLSFLLTPSFVSFHNIVLILLSMLFRTYSLLIQSYFQCTKQVNKYVYISFTYVLVLFVGIFSLIEMVNVASAFSLALFISSISQFLISKILIADEFRLVSKVSLDNKLIKKVFLSSVVFFPSAVGWWIKNGADRFIINKYFEPEVLGIYSLWFQMFSITVLALNVINLAFVPELNKSLKDRRLFDTKKLVLIEIIIFAVIVLIVGFIVNIFIREIYDPIYYSAVDYIYSLLIAFFFQGIMMIVINILYFYDKGFMVAKSIILIFSIQVIANFKLASVIGLSGMIYISVLCNFILMLFFIYEAKKHF